jgi:hypothetical protein
MKKHLILGFFLSIIYSGFAQELFVITEPASNMPAASLGIRLGQSFMKENKSQSYNYHLYPEIMWGASKNIMLHATAFYSNTEKEKAFEGGSIYAKYRFFSVDDFHSHFRMAFFGRYSANNAVIHQEEINLYGHNTGLETGLVVTQLLQKTAIGSSISFRKAFDNQAQHFFPEKQSNTAIHYTVSFGRLVYPKTYSSFKETNVNVMLELEGQTLLPNKKSFLAIVPAIQFIINSQARIDLAYQQQLYSNLTRTAPNGIYIKLEYTFFNISN